MEESPESQQYEEMSPEKQGSSPQEERSPGEEGQL